MKEHFQKLKSFYAQTLRVWQILRRPSREEFTTVAKVSAIGILIIGFVGFVISILLNVI